MRANSKITLSIIQCIQAHMIHLITSRHIWENAPMQIVSVMVSNIKSPMVITVQIPIPVDVTDFIKVLGIKQESRSIV